MENLLEELKKNVSGIIGTINEDNLEEVKEEVAKYFQLAEVMIDLIGGKKKPKAVEQTLFVEPPQKKVVVNQVEEQNSPTVEAVPPLIEKTLIPVEEKIAAINPATYDGLDEVTKKEETNAAVLKQLADSFEEDKVQLGYPLSRNLAGGFLLTGSSSNSIFVPESVVRELGLDDGDIVSAEVIPGGSNLKPFYKYNLVKKGQPLKEATRKEFSFGIVDYDENIKQFFVERNSNKESLRINDVPNRFMISQEDARQYYIKKDDIVDVAWYDNNFTKGRVIWKYTVTESVKLKETTHQKMLNYKAKVRSEEVTGAIKETKEDFSGKKICLVGVEPYHSEFKEIIESRGGRIIALTSGTNKITMNASIRKSDLVIVGISHTSHAASQYANERAKHYGIPFKAFSGFGKTTFLKTINEGLEIKQA